MGDIAFSEPVILQFPGLGERKVANSFEALECLYGEWPDWARGRDWRHALAACRDVLDGWRDTKFARRRFVKAARRAGLMPGYRRFAPRLPEHSPLYTPHMDGQQRTRGLPGSFSLRIG